MTITIEKSIELSAPTDEVYERWADFASYADFMPHVKSVEQTDSGLWRWLVSMGGQDLQWDTELTAEEPGRLISWQTTGKGTRSSTTVSLQALEDGRTAVTFTAHYPNGVGKSLTAADIAAQAEQSLQRFAAFWQPGQETGPEDADKDTEQNQSTSDVLGPSYSFSPAGTTAFGQTWREQVSMVTDPTRRGESALSHGMDALLSFNPFAHLPPPHSVVQHAWFSSMFQVMEGPFNTMKRLSEQLDRNIEAFLWGGAGNGRPLWAVQNGAGWTPAVDIDETDETLKVRADLPGVGEDGLEVAVRDGMLVISGEVRPEGGSQADSAAGNQAAPSQGRFSKSITLPAGVDAVGAEATLHDGVLEVTLAGPAMRQRRIDIRAGLH